MWTGAENLAPPGFDPRTVQPVASRYTDYVTRPATEDEGGLRKILLVCVSAVCCIMAETFTYRRITTKALVLSEASPCGFCGEKIATRGTFWQLGKITKSDY